MKGFHANLGSAVNKIITFIVFIALLRIFDEPVKPTLIAIFIAYPLTG